MFLMKHTQLIANMDMSSYTYWQYYPWEILKLYWYWFLLWYPRNVQLHLVWFFHKHPKIDVQFRYIVYTANYMEIYLSIPYYKSPVCRVYHRVKHLVVQLESMFRLYSCGSICIKEGILRICNNYCFNI